MSTNTIGLGAVVVLLSGAVVPGGARQQGGAAAVECTLASLQARAPSGTTITGAEQVDAAAGVPSYCRVEGAVETPGNRVNFRLGLPAGWSGNFHFQGVGGYAGSIGPLDAGLRRGYASASTDTGHQGSATDAEWALNNRPKEIDFAHRGAHVTTVAGKQLTEGYYGSAPRHAYFNGCSNGGRMALIAAQRYPEDFDGIVAGAPALGDRIKRVLVYQTMLSSPDHYLPAAKLGLLSNAVVQACDAADGLKDGLVGDPRACRFRPETLKCQGADGPGCLTAGQVETVAAIYADAMIGGRRIRGLPVGHEAGPSGWESWITGTVAPVARPGDGKLVLAERAPLGYRFMDGFFRYLAFDVDDSHYDWRTFKIERDLAKLDTMTELVTPTPDLRAFRQRGGKLVMYHGWADPALSAYSTIDYLEAVAQAVGGPHAASEFVKLFLVPGMQHCSGGPGPNSFDMLSALDDWVARGAAPARIIASHATSGVVDRTRPLCVYPQVARYVGSGSIDTADNFRCETPAAARR
jgi:feruloyl esterase